MHPSTPEAHHGSDHQSARRGLAAQTPADTTNGRTVRYGIVAILGAFIFPPVGIIYAVRSVREPKRSKGFRTFSVVAAGIVTVTVIAYSLLFAGGALPFTNWVVSH